MATQTASRTRLETLVEGFDRDTAVGRISIRALMERDPRAFQEGVIPVLKSCSSSRGIQYVVSLLVSGNYLFNALCAPGLTTAEAALLARTAMQVDPQTDVNLAKRLADEAGGRNFPAAAGRLMEVLDEVTNGDRIMPHLLRIMRQADPQIRSKAVLMIGRASQSLDWVRRGLDDADPRTRASAVESLWGAECEEALELMRTAAGDANNRVAGNALFALYGMGETASLRQLLKMAASESPMFRASAAWAMGETGDRRFTDALGRMMCDSQAFVRKRAFSALGQIRGATAKARLLPEWKVTGRLLPLNDGARQLLVEAGPADLAAPPKKLMGTQFILTENKQAVLDYRLEDKAPPEILAVSFVLPGGAAGGVSPCVRGVLNSLARKRASDLWRTAFYSEGETAGEPAPEPAEFTADAKAAALSLEKPPEQSECRDFWGCLRESVNAAAAGTGRVIAYAANPGAVEDADAIVAAAVAAQVTVDAISGGPNGALELLCRSTLGSFQIATPGDDLARMVEDAYQILLARYLITYTPTSAQADSLHIWVSNESGWGETTIALT